MTTRTTLLIALGLVAVLGLASAGCKAPADSNESHEGHDHPPAATEKPADPAAPATAAAEGEPAQKLCPVMGLAINKNVYVDHEGRRVYFCCPACPEKFKAEPEKYLKKLDEQMAAGK